VIVDLLAPGFLTIAMHLFSSIRRLIRWVSVMGPRALKEHGHRSHVERNKAEKANFVF
jgi:hypothetical protein